MKPNSGLKILLMVVAAIGLTMRANTPMKPAAPARNAPGAIVGIVRNSDKVPVSGRDGDRGEIRRRSHSRDAVRQRRHLLVR